MIKRIRFLWQQQRVLLLVFCVLIGALGVFGVRTVSATIYWMDPAHQEQPLAGWMTPRYVARSYKLPPDALGEALMFDKDAPIERRSLDTIAAENGMTMQDLQERVDAAARAVQAERDK